ncbi:MAG: hypothetical protein GEV10_08420 [Streptosporangiales bacterium]|nr:hypothetical protein [Streptosporangiales bacterium]
MSQPPHGGWQVPDRPVSPYGQAPYGPPPGQAPPPGPPGAHRYPTRPRPVPVPPHSIRPLPPPVSPPGSPHPRPYGYPARPPRSVVPPVPVVDPPGSYAAKPPPMQLPPPPGPTGKAPTLRTAKRVPSDLPFVVRPRLSMWLLLFCVPLVVLLAVTGYLFVTGGWRIGLIGLVVAVGLYTVGFGFRVFNQVTGGPLLAADRQGVWLRIRKWPVLAAQIPWELIAEIRPKRWLVEKVICVVPRDPRVGQLKGSWSALDQARTTAFFGSPLTASTAYSDKPADETMRALADLSFGRARIVGARPKDD